MTLLVVTGLPATGKTTLARRLACRYRAALLAKDAVKDTLLAIQGASDRAASRRLSDASFAAIFAIALELVAADVDVILEGNFRPGTHESALAPVIESARSLQRSLQIGQVLCRCGESERLARLGARAADSERHHGHHDLDPLVVADRSSEAFLHIEGSRFEYRGRADEAAIDRWWRGEF